MIRAWKALPDSLRQTATGFIAGAFGGGLLLAILRRSAIRSLIEDSGLPSAAWSTMTLPLAFLAAGIVMALLVVWLGRGSSSEHHDIR